LHHDADNNVDYNHDEGTGKESQRGRDDGKFPEFESVKHGAALKIKIGAANPSLADQR
jgi:hypothetical protein